MGRGACEDSYRDDQPARNRPNQGCLGDRGKKSGQEGIDQKGESIVTNVDQKLMPTMRFVRGRRERDDPQDELATQETSSRGQCDPARSIDPSRDPRQDWNPTFPADDSDPVILSARGGIPGPVSALSS